MSFLSLADQRAEVYSPLLGEFSTGKYINSSLRGELRSHRPRSCPQLLKFNRLVQGVYEKYLNSHDGGSCNLHSRARESESRAFLASAW